MGSKSAGNVCTTCYWPSWPNSDLELMDGDNPSGLVGGGSRDAPADAARWLERNRRVLQRYQALVRTAVTLDALLDAEDGIAQEPS